MKYFTEEYDKAVDVEPDYTEEQRQQAFLHYQQTLEAYHHELDELKPRLSKPAWNFFRWEGAETGLHDAPLLSLTIGDGLDYKLDWTTPFRLNHQRTVARISFLNYTQKYHYIFDLRGLRRARMDIFTGKLFPIKRIGDLYTYELTGIDQESLRLGFQFATGAEIEFEFRKLVFRRRNLKRQYSPGEMYG
jgi:hypothetical protein